MMDQKTAAVLEKVESKRVMPATLMDLVPVERAGLIQRHKTAGGYLSWTLTEKGISELDGYRVAMAS